MSNDGPKLLAIDDNQDNLTTLRAVVRDAIPDAEIRTASSGPEGLELARSGELDVILLDIVMPDMDGFAVCRELKRDERLREIPVLFLTALGSSRDARITALEVGADGFLTKPWDEAELIAQIRSMARHRASARDRRLEEQRLATLIAERTRALELELGEHARADAKVKSQLDELQRWQDVMLGREDRVQELKREVNELCRRLGEPPRYPSQYAAPAEPPPPGEGER